MTTTDGDTSDQSASREITLRRGTAATSMLRAAARLAHAEAMPVSSLPSILRPRGDVAEGTGGWFSVAVRLSFLLLFVVPSVLAIIYYSLIASGQYETELRFSVRNGDASALEQMSQLSSLSSVASISQTQDTLVVTNFVKSRALVEQLDSELNLRAMFSRDNIDFVSALSADAPIERLVDYWQHRIHVSIETQSGLVTIDIKAFTPADTLAIAQALIRHSETLVNEMSARSSKDLLRDTQAELGRAEARLKETRLALQDLRNSEGHLDADTTAKGLDDVLSQLQLERAQAAEQLSTISSGLSPNAPQLRAVKARVAALDAQIAKIQAEMTGGSKGDQKDLSGAMTRFDSAQLDNEVAEKRYAAAVSALEAARLSAERQRVYINTFVEPSLPQSATAPSRSIYIAAIVVGSFIAWSLLVGTAGVIRRRMI